MIALILIALAAGIAGIITTCSNSCKRISCALGQIELKQMR